MTHTTSNPSDTTNAPDLRDVSDAVNEAILNARSAGADESAAARGAAAALGVDLPDDLLADALADCRDDA
ncbi:hypothetical protein [Baekduia sp. Peel2402]|uniref:hypothetical protein n=1 Tax=Baekduia sp. Peel2402 TaxID=3458296 RepID=UPI00403E9BFD